MFAHNDFILPKTFLIYFIMMRKFKILCVSNISFFTVTHRIVRKNHTLTIFVASAYENIQKRSGLFYFCLYIVHLGHITQKKLSSFALSTRQCRAVGECDSPTCLFVLAWNQWTYSYLILFNFGDVLQLCYIK